MRVEKTIKKAKGARLSMKSKLILSLSSIGAILLISCTLSVMEYTRMSAYVSDLIAADINKINISHQLADMTNEYNLNILAVIGDDLSARLPDFDDGYFKARCDSLRNSQESSAISSYADSVLYSYSAYMLTSRELEDVLQSDFIDSRSWFFERLQPQFDRLHGSINNLASAVYRDLEKNSATFDRGFYRSVVPGIVAVGVGLLLIFMLLLFILSDYVRPIGRMLSEFKAYRSNDKKYSLTFEGDDELSELNQDITDLASENRQLRERIKALRNRVQANTEDQQ